VAEPDEPVSEIKGVGLLGFLAVVITPEERGGELTGELGMLKRLLAAGEVQEALGDRTASGAAFTGASDLERLQIGVFGTHPNTLSTAFDGLLARAREDSARERVRELSEDELRDLADIEQE
jgi:hypothetical protein